MSGTLSGKVAVVTGARRGIGKPTCWSSCNAGRSGARVENRGARERTPGTLNETAEAIRASGGDALVVKTDLASQHDLDRLIAATLERHGHVDILVNNAVYTVGKALWAHVPELTRDQWEKGFAVNVTAPLMLIEGSGRPSPRTRRWRDRERHVGRMDLQAATTATHSPAREHVPRQRAIIKPGVEGGAQPDGERDRGEGAAAQHRGDQRRTGLGAHRGDGADVQRDGGRRRPDAAGDPADCSGEAAIAYLCTCDDPMQYSGEIVGTRPRWWRTCSSDRGRRRALRPAGRSRAGTAP